MPHVLTLLCKMGWGELRTIKIETKFPFHQVPLCLRKGRCVATGEPADVPPASAKGVVSLQPPRAAQDLSAPLRGSPNKPPAVPGVIQLLHEKLQCNATIRIRSRLQCNVGDSMNRFPQLVLRISSSSRQASAFASIIPVCELHSLA